MTGRRDADALADLLRYAAGPADTQALASALLERFGSLAAVLDARHELLLAVPGMTGHTAILLNLIPQLGRKAMAGPVPRKSRAETPEQAAQLLRPCFFGHTAETLYGLFVDGKRRVLDRCKVSRGAERFANINARRLADIALECAARGLYLAHNHPRGLPQASPEDRALTQKLTGALHGLDIGLIGHFVFSDEEYTLI